MYSAAEDTIPAIVLIFWKIKPDASSVTSFLTCWRTLMPVADRGGLVAEFVTRPVSSDVFSWITFPLPPPDICRPFISVGLWRSANDFEGQLSRYFRTDVEKEHFEVELRRRTLITPEYWRRGLWPLPELDSPDTR